MNIETLITFLTLENNNLYNHCHPSIQRDMGHHSQFLWCSMFLISKHFLPGEAKSIAERWNAAEHARQGAGECLSSYACKSQKWPIWEWVWLFAKRAILHVRSAIAWYYMRLQQVVSTLSSFPQPVYFIQNMFCIFFSKKIPAYFSKNLGQKPLEDTTNLEYNFFD